MAIKKYVSSKAAVDSSLFSRELKKMVTKGLLVKVATPTNSSCRYKAPLYVNMPLQLCHQHLSSNFETNE